LLALGLSEWSFVAGIISLRAAPASVPNSSQPSAVAPREKVRAEQIIDLMAEPEKPSGLAARQKGATTGVPGKGAIRRQNRRNDVICSLVWLAHLASATLKRCFERR